MKATKELKEHNQVVLTISADENEFAEAVMAAYKKVKNQVTIPGFRKGKATKALIEKTYGEGVFYEDAMDFILKDTYPKAIDECELDPVSSPEIDVVKIGKEGVEYTATLYVKPEITLPKLSGIKVEKVEYVVKDEDVDAEIKNMAERVAHFVDITDKPIENGNIAVIDFEGFVDGVAFDGGKGENHNLTIGSGEFIPGFEEQLVGKNIGDEVDVNVTFPEEYHAEDLKGKAAVFKVKVNGIKQKEYPALDDEFAKDVSEFETFEELKNATKERLTKAAETRTTNEQQSKAVDAVSEATEFDIPDAMVETQIDEYVRDMEYRIQMQMPGITFEQYLQFTGMDLNQFRDSMKDRALADVKARLVLETVVKEQKFEVSDEEVAEEISKIAEQYKMETEKVKELLGENGIENIKSDINVRKALVFITEQVKIK